MRVFLLALGVAVLGVVLARTHETPPSVHAMPGVDDNQKHQPDARVIRSLPIPQYNQIQSAAQNQAATMVAALHQPVVAWTDTQVRRGDSLSAIFSRLEMHSQLGPVLALKDAKTLRAIYPGQVLKVRKTPEGELQELQYDEDDNHRLRIWRTEEGLQSEIVERTAEVRQALAAGTITNSLFLSGLNAGLSDNLIMELAGIFGWDIDFALDIREGDQFAVLYEEYYREGEKLRDGRILAAEFINQGRPYRAVLFSDPDGKERYYSPDGRSMRKAFLRAPVDFRRISSGFQRSRLHPILGKKRAHKGVDYAAATGTPIRAAGDGKVVFRGVKGGYGNVIILQHGHKYSTLYAHMSRFAGTARVGRRIQQGQTIGYVGQSGMATGPHLHYEFRVNGVHRNPLTVQLPSAQPLPEKYMADFETHSSALLSRLDTYRRVAVASSTP